MAKQLEYIGGQTREEVIAELGQPDWLDGGPHRYPIPSRYMYGNIELGFDPWKDGGLHLWQKHVVRGRSGWLGKIGAFLLSSSPLDGEFTSRPSPLPPDAFIFKDSLVGQKVVGFFRSPWKEGDWELCRHYRFYFQTSGGGLYEIGPMYVAEAEHSLLSTLRKIDVPTRTISQSDDGYFWSRDHTSGGRCLIEAVFFDVSCNHLLIEFSDHYFLTASHIPGSVTVGLLNQAEFTALSGNPAENRRDYWTGE